MREDLSISKVQPAKMNWSSGKEKFTSTSIFSGRQLRYVRYMLSQFRLSVVCNVGAPYSAG